jgi:cell division transport system permease protein
MLYNASPSEINAVKVQLGESQYVTHCVYFNQLDDYNEARRIEAASIFDVLKVATMPTSFRCQPVVPDDAKIVQGQFQGTAGVLTVIAPDKYLHEVQTTVTGMQIAFLVIAAVLLLSATVLILNTIRMAIFARRREVSVMKLVGATNWFIRLPFIAEGLIQGVIGALLASGVVYGIHVTVNHLSDSANPGSLLTEMRLTGWQVFVTDAVVVLLGAAIGSIGSAFAIRRFLDV